MLYQVDNLRAGAAPITIDQFYMSLLPSIPFSALIAETAPSISPEQLRAITDLLKAVGQSGEGPGALTAAYIKAIADLISAIAWPIAAVLCVILFRKQLSDFFSGVQTVKFANLEISRQITSELKISEQEAESLTGKSNAPTQGELSRATVVERIISKADLSVIERNVNELAVEYERIRGSMLPGDKRTRRMEVVVSKMRTLGLAAYPLRYELANSPSPGKRLFAIAILQVEPDYDMLDWLSRRLAVEKPFVGYHALIAMLLAVRGQNARDHLSSIQGAMKELESAQGSIGADTDRAKVLKEIEDAVDSLRS
jgi:hypothetical protein